MLWCNKYVARRSISSRSAGGVFSMEAGFCARGGGRWQLAEGCTCRPSTMATLHGPSWAVGGLCAQAADERPKTMPAVRRTARVLLTADARAETGSRDMVTLLGRG